VSYPALLPPDDLARLREALTAAGFTSAGIAERLGPDATAALRHNDFRAALAATTSGDALDTLIRLYECGTTEPEHAVAAAFAPLPLPAALAAGLVERTTANPRERTTANPPERTAASPREPAAGLRAALDLEPYGESWWIVADLPAGSRPGPLPADHVLGVGGASATLAASVIRDPVGTALDLGTGCGVQALHLSIHAGRVTATDVSPRALRFAATTAALAGLGWDLREGDMTGPVQGERFDLVVSNPPFVAGPGTATHTYRDSGRPGDALCADLAGVARDLLEPGGTIQFLANWLHVRGEDWADRVAGWFAGSGLDVWAIQREVSDPHAYVDLWLSDAAEEHDPRRAADWLDWFDAQKVEAIGFGLVTARNGGHDTPVVRVETLRQPLPRPFGQHVSAWFDRQDWLRCATADDMLGARYRATDGLRLHQEAVVGPEGWDVVRQSLVQTTGLGWSEEVDPVLVALIGGCDGTVLLRDQVAVLAAAYDTPLETFQQMALLLVSHLVERAFVEPVR
jgi:methylase of polypeptide subunit release factors